MTPNRHFLVLSLALRRRLIPEALFHAISEVAAGGQDPVDLLWTRGRLDEATLKDLLAEAARAGSGQVTARPSSADPQPQRQPLPSPSPLAVPRYELGAEIGAGGLGQVVEATDTSIGRQVALKLLVRDADEDLLRRFRWEGRITGRLEHPNIVPVHELGALPGNGQAYICMKRIVGRNMKEVIRSGAWKPRRLVEALRDVCRAVAYAHSRGVIHRDLKPANVMLGDFGEVLVVDWGIARLAGEEELARMAPVSPARPSGDPEARGGTQAGMVFGTPSYMSPEQAMGQADQVDERSDVYSLGATLYEILAGVPPYDAESDLEIMEKVVLADLKPPSEVRSCPPDLESICLQAMARRREDRYGSVAELGGDIESYLEGTKEAERRERLAHEQLARAREQLDLSAHLQAESAGVLAAAPQAAGIPSAGDWTKTSRVLWAHEDRAEGLRRDSVEALATAEAALETALALDPLLSEARALRARIHWTKFLEAERTDDPDGMILNRRAVERFNDGAFSARLVGDGSLEVRIGRWGCTCLREGRAVAPAELAVMGYHPWSGRRIDGRPAENVPGLERAAPARLRVHGPDCTRIPDVAARAWAFRFELVDRMLLPCSPGTSGPGVPDGILDRLYGTSRFRPRGGGIEIGRLPAVKRSWPMGSWLLIVAPDAGEPFRVPFHVGREQAVALDLTAYAEDDLPPGFALIPAGEFAWQGDRGTPAGGELRRLHLDDFLIARLPVTCREYAVFLNDLFRVSPEEAEARAPREADGAPPMWPADDAAGYRVPTRTSGLGDQGHRLAHVPLDWEESWPVLSISWADASAFAKWKSAREGSLFCLPHEVQWEKAARGPDARVYPWGTAMDPRLCNINTTHAEGPHPVAIGAFPLDESPYGLRDLGGNARDWCLNDPGDPQHSGWRVVRGGNWHNPAAGSRVCYRAAAPVRGLQPMNSFRLAVALRIPGRTMPLA